MSILSELAGDAFSDIVSGFIWWLLKGCKTRLKEEITKHHTRNMLTTFFLIVGIVVGVLLIISLIT